MGFFAPNFGKLEARKDVRGLLQVSLKDPDQYGRTCREVILGLGLDAIPPLVSLLNDEQLAPAAGQCLLAIGDDALPAVLELAESDDRQLQLQALQALYKFARISQTTEAFDEILVLAKSNDKEVSQLARAMSKDIDAAVVAWFCQRIDPILELLKTEDDPARAGAMVANVAKTSIPGVFREGLIEGVLPYASSGSSWADLLLTEIGGPAVQPTIEAMESGQSGLCWTLIMLGIKYPEALAAVEHAATAHESEDIRAEAVQALVMKTAADRLL